MLILSDNLSEINLHLKTLFVFDRLQDTAVGHLWVVYVATVDGLLKVISEPSSPSLLPTLAEASCPSLLELVKRVVIDVKEVKTLIDHRFLIQLQERVIGYIHVDVFQNSFEFFWLVYWGLLV